MTAERREQVGLVDGDQRRMPVLRRALDQGAEQRGDGDHLALAVQIGEVDEDRETVLADAVRQRDQRGGIKLVGLDVDMAKGLREAAELALWIDDDLLHAAGGLLEQASERPRFPRARSTLDEKPAFQQLLEIDAYGASRVGRAQAEIARRQGRERRSDRLMHRRYEAQRGLLAPLVR